MNRPHPAAGILWFFVKFVVIVAVLLTVWWTIQPQYVSVIGRLAGVAIVYLGGVDLDRTLVEVDESGVLNTRTSLVYIQSDRRYPINVAYLIANLPTYIALVLATTGLAWKRRLAALLIGGAVLLLGQVTFLAVMFIFARQVQSAPEVPTAFGMFIMTLPFLLWIVLAYRDRVIDFFENATNSRDEPREPAS
jgi:hypothetical protein